jgi:hypothetical protein
MFTDTPGRDNRADRARVTSDAATLGGTGEGWLKLVANFHNKQGGLRWAIGRPDDLEAEAAKREKR